MTLFLFERIDELTGNYHPEGGLVIIAKTEEEARKLCPGNVTDQEWADAHRYPVKAKKSEVFIFPDAGCC